MQSYILSPSDVSEESTASCFYCVLAENVTKDCDSLGNWIQSGPTCQPASRQTFQVVQRLHTNTMFAQHSVHQSSQLVKDEPAEPLTEETRLRAEKSPVLELLLENEEECSEKMRRDPPYSRSGSRSSVPTLFLRDGFGFDASAP